MHKKLYIIVDRRLTSSQKIPQAVHAMDELASEYGQNDNYLDWLKNHKTVIVLKANAEQIEYYRKEMYNVGVNSKIFIDEDLDNMLTAVAFEPIDSNLGREMFSSLQLA